MIEKDENWRELKPQLIRFLMSGNCDQDQIYRVLGLIINLYEENFIHIQNCMKKLEL